MLLRSIQTDSIYWIRFNLLRVRYKICAFLFRSNIFSALTIVLLFTSSVLLPGYAYEGISSYYLRYDIQSHKNQLKEERLIMVPVEDEFRAENFSLCTISGTLSARPGELKPMIEKRVREQTLKSVLREKGLKSVKATNYDTIVSYEGVVMVPIQLEMMNVGKQEIHFRAGIQFSPLAFPDRWETLQSKHRMKQAIQDFFLLFK